MSDQINLRNRILAPTPTGRHIVKISKKIKKKAAQKKIQSAVGRNVVLSSEFDNNFSEMEAALKDEGAILLEDINVGIIENSGLGALALGNLKNEPGIENARPEFYMYAPNHIEERYIDWVREGLLILSDQVKQLPVEMQAQLPSAIPETEDATWGLHATKILSSPFTGEGIKIAILDTGLDFQHPDFSERNIIKESFVSEEKVDDKNGHGTHCAGIAAGPQEPFGTVPRYGVAPGADLYIAKVLNNAGVGREGDILAGMLWAIENQCDIISMSLGGPPLQGDEDSEYARVGEKALKQGSLIIAAAGNDSIRRWNFISPVSAPANAPSIMAIGAIDERLQIADFSNGGLQSNGGKINICAPGVDIFSSWSLPRTHNTISGTSMSTPYVAGIAALFAESDTSLRGQKLWKALEALAQDIGLSSRDAGAGLVQAPQQSGINLQVV